MSDVIYVTNCLLQYVIASDVYSRIIYRRNAADLYGAVNQIKRFKGKIRKSQFLHAVKYRARSVSRLIK